MRFIVSPERSVSASEHHPGSHPWKATEGPQLLEEEHTILFVCFIDGGIHTVTIETGAHKTFASAS